MKFVFRWAFRAFVVLLVLVIGLVLLKDDIARSLLESRIHAETGLEAKIGRFEIGLFTPTLTVENFKLYNPPDFGGAPFVDLPELHLEYDRNAALEGRLRLKLLRVHLAEVSVVESKDGRRNIYALQQDVEKRHKARGPREAPSLEFAGIDTLNFTIGKVRLTNLKQPGKDTELDIGLKNQVVNNVKSGKDLTGALLNALLAKGVTIFEDGTVGARGAPKVPGKSAEKGGKKPLDGLKLPGTK
ncbi:MAG: AsmA family protein [Verrucomicrobia bacterium]|nr:AsmA family protein [Verrucomicrobiota bacterium]